MSDTAKAAYFAKMKASRATEIAEDVARRVRALCDNDPRFEAILLAAVETQIKNLLFLAQCRAVEAGIAAMSREEPAP